MFNGLIEARGAVFELAPIPDGFRIMVTTPLAAGLVLGESIAVNGVCLTVVETDSKMFQAEISPETLRVTALGTLQAGRGVNLERPMLADARVGARASAMRTFTQVSETRSSRWTCQRSWHGERAL